jgi:phosphatidylglycerophosphatase A
MTFRTAGSVVVSGFLSFVAYHATHRWEAAILTFFIYGRIDEIKMWTEQQSDKNKA